MSKIRVRVSTFTLNFKVRYVKCFTYSKQKFCPYLNLFEDPSDWLHGGEHKTWIWTGVHLCPGRRKTSKQPPKELITNKSIKQYYISDLVTTISSPSSTSCSSTSLSDFTFCHQFNSFYLNKRRRLQTTEQLSLNLFPLPVFPPKGVAVAVKSW